MQMATPDLRWLDLPAHHRWLADEEDRLVAPHEVASLHDGFGFMPLDQCSRACPDQPRDLFAVARHVHCFALEHLRGRPGCLTIAQTGVNALLTRFSDGIHGGFWTRVASDGTVIDDAKTAYGHAFVLLAASSASGAGIDQAAELFDSVNRAIDMNLWREDEGAVIDSCDANWAVREPNYRGQNANMHLVEAYLAAHDQTADHKWLHRAVRIAHAVVGSYAPGHEWRHPEHFDADWNVSPSFHDQCPNDPLRPPGCVVGHWLEWSRLLVQIAGACAAERPWAMSAATGLFAAAIRDGWDFDAGGFRYRVDLSGQVLSNSRCHWVIAEAVGAAAALARVTGRIDYRSWYARFWEYIETHHIDREGGGWWHEVDDSGSPLFDIWNGKPDLYHALQATLYARSPLACSLVEAARTGRISDGSAIPATVN